METSFTPLCKLLLLSLNSMSSISFHICTYRYTCPILFKQLYYNLLHCRNTFNYYSLKNIFSVQSFAQMVDSHHSIFNSSSILDISSNIISEERSLFSVAKVAMCLPTPSLFLTNYPVLFFQWCLSLSEMILYVDLFTYI